jgi:uncharacterized protein (TIGR03118 family)
VKAPLSQRSRILAAAIAAAALAAAIVAGGTAASPRSAKDLGTFVQTNLVSDDPAAVPAPNTDPHLVNAWGLVAGPGTPFWVADNGTDLSTLYDGAGTTFPLVVHVGGGPTGTVFNGGTGFVVSDGSDSGPSRFIFASEDGRIRGWSPAVPSPAPSTQTFVGVGRAAVHAIYKGLAIASTPSGDRIYATDFHNNRVDVFDATFAPVTTGGFKDAKVPDGFAPFGIQALGGSIFVTYAKQDAAAKDDVAVPGQAYVDEYSPDGQLVARVINSGKKNAPLNAPWGLALAPADFGPFGGDLLVGNFGNGRISAYAKGANGWVFKGQLRHASGAPIELDGLWAIAFGNGNAAGPTTSLYFLSGPSDESHGLFGSITAG